MSILTKEDRKDLVYAMRVSLLEQVRGKGILTESKKAAAENFILNEATYEQLLNLAYNPERETNYLQTESLERVALEAYQSYLSTPQESQFGAIEEGVGSFAKGVGKAISKDKNRIKQSFKGATKYAKAQGAGRTKATLKGLKSAGKKAMQTKTGKVAAGGTVGLGATGAVAARRKKKK